jgi:hypothetical protein
MALSGPYTNFTGLVVNGAIVDPNQPIPFARARNPLAKILYVRSTGGNGDGTGFGTGQTPQEPYSTLAAAITSLAGRTTWGDVIYVLPGHVESISAPDYFSGGGTAANFSVIGLGSGTNRPTFTWTVATSTWLIDTAGVEISNIRCFLAGAHAAGAALTVAAPITISAANCRITNCEFWWGFDVDQIVGTGITTTAAASDFTFAYNNCYALVAAVPTATFMTLVGSDRCQIIGNYITGATSGTTVGVIRGLTTASLNMYVAFNTMDNLLASSTIAFSPLTASTGVATQNQFLVDTGILPITASILHWFDNLCCNDAGENGAQVGTASA